MSRFLYLIGIGVRRFGVAAGNDGGPGKGRGGLKRHGPKPGRGYLKRSDKSNPGFLLRVE